MMFDFAIFILNKPPRRMLKDNAIPTLFNKDKQLIKRKSVLSRNEIAPKK